ncbi:hypothetical protein Tco_0448943 [Tanacetum coccineum]
MTFIFNGYAVWNGIGVNASDSKLMLLVNAVRHKLTAAGDVDGKKIIVTKSIIRRDLQLEDAEGVDCLPNATIFEQLTLMGRSKRKDTEVPQPSSPTTNVADEATNEEMDNSLVRAATTASSLEVEHDSGNINKTQSKATPNEPSSLRTSSGGGPRRQETIWDTIAHTRSQNVSKLSNDPLLAKGNTLQSGKDSLKLNELMELCTNLQQRVLDLETTKTTQATKIASLKRRVKKLKRRNKSRTHGLKRLNRVGSSRSVESSKDEGLDGDEVIVESVDVVNTVEETRSVVEEVTAVTIPVSVATTTTTTIVITDVEMTLAQALAELKSAKPKADKVVIQEPEQGTTTPTLTTTTGAIIIIAVKVHVKGKGKMVEPEPVKKMSKKELLRLDEELAFNLQSKEEEEEEEEERLARQKAQQVEEANIA